MTLVLIIVFFLIMFIIVKEKKNIEGFSRRLFYVYLAYWFLSFFFSALNPVGLISIAPLTYLFVAMHILFFWLGYSKIVAIRKGNVINLDHIHQVVSNVMNNAFFRVILVVSILYLASLVAVFYERMLMYQSMGDVRTDYYDNNLYGPFFGKIQALFLLPLNFFVVAMLSVSLIKDRIFTINNLLLFLYYLLYSSLSGGRGAYITLLWGIIFIAFCVKNIIKEHKIKLFAYGLPVLLSVYFFLSMLTAARLGDISFSKNALNEGSEKLSQSLVIYTSGPLVAFNYAIEQNYVTQVGGYKYGGFTLSAPISLFNIVGRKIGIEIPQAINDVVELKQGTPFEIAEGEWYNALYTSCFWYYLDFDFYGLILFPFLLGGLVRWVIKKAYIYQTLPMIVILYMTYHYTIKSVMDLYLNNPLTLLMMIIFFIWGKQIAKTVKKIC